MTSVYSYTFMVSAGYFIGAKVFSDEIHNYFMNLIINTMKQRQEKNIHRPDIIHLLMEAKKGTLKHESDAKIDDTGFATVKEYNVRTHQNKRDWSDNELVAQATGFLFAGFDTTSSAMSFAVYELAINPNIQTKLQKEIDEIIEVHGEKLTYDIIQKMKYMDMVISETLRKWPPFPILSRTCTKNYTFGPTRADANNSYSVKNGDDIWIPTSLLHHDSKWWPHPEKFDPERFSDDNKDKIKPYTYIPFGAGIRNCVGSRFALMEIKVFLYYLFANFNCVVGKKTAIPLKLKTRSIDSRPISGFWLNIVPRIKKNN